MAQASYGLKGTKYSYIEQFTFGLDDIESSHHQPLLVHQARLTRLILEFTGLHEGVGILVVIVNVAELCGSVIEILH